MAEKDLGSGSAHQGASGHQGPNDNQLEDLLRNSAPITQDLDFDTTFYDEIIAKVESLEAARIEKPTGVDDEKKFVKSCIDDKYHMIKKIHTPECCLDKEMADFMKPGLRVAPGTDWGYPGNNGNGVGTVTDHSVDGHGDKYWSVHWDGKDEPSKNYRMGGEYPKYDLRIVGFFISTDNEFHVKVTYSDTIEEEKEKYFKIGMRVQRRKNRHSGNTEGNDQGSIVGTSEIGDKIRWRVKWDSKDSSTDNIEVVKTVGFFKKTTENKFYYIQPAVSM